jgi:hypothetical protein
VSHATTFNEVIPEYKYLLEMDKLDDVSRGWRGLLQKVDMSLPEAEILPMYRTSKILRAIKEKYPMYGLMMRHMSASAMYKEDRQQVLDYIALCQ